MNRSISALSWGLPTSERGGYGAGKEPSVSLFSLISFPTSYLLPLLISFPALTNIRCASKASFSWFPFSEFVSFSGCSITPPTLLSCGAFVIHRREEEEEKRERRGEWVLLFRTDGILCLSGGQNVPARVLLMLNGTGRWIIPCTALSLDKFKGSPTTRHHGRKLVRGRLDLSFSSLPLFISSFPNSLLLSSQVLWWKSFHFSLILCLACTHLHIHKQLNNMSSFTSCINSFLGTTC